MLGWGWKDNLDFGQPHLLFGTDGTQTSSLRRSSVLFFRQPVSRSGRWRHLDVPDGTLVQGVEGLTDTPVLLPLPSLDRVRGLFPVLGHVAPVSDCWTASLTRCASGEVTVPDRRLRRSCTATEESCDERHSTRPLPAPLPDNVVRP